MSATRPKLGVSSCLMGQQVRYDGGHKHNRYVTEMLGEWFDFVPWCPEVAIGLSIPRPPIRLVKKDDRIRAVGVEDGNLDVTERLADYARDNVPYFDELSGYIVKKDSPSCGMERVKIYTEGMPERKGTGIYTGVMMEAMPDLPVEEEGRLSDPGLRENFIDRVFTRFRWQQMMADGLSPAALVDFHTRHKFFILAHNEPVYRKLGQLVARAGKEDLAQLANEYFHLLMDGLKTKATPGKHANVLMHIMGFFKEELDADDKQELLEIIEAYRNGLVPLVVPVTLPNHFL
ncbi:MAG: DUF523 and DUF1722 domain-containing protein, partial [Pseudomonadales bacterium]|nr:DUF523 and DUF1722 domain-containing protein [Pseudomonadales bacterium]